MRVPNRDGKEYSTQKRWPMDTVLSCGERSLSGARMSFFEAFVSSPCTLIRMEANTIQEAEQACWDQYLRIKDCHGHKFLMKHYRNGASECKNCGLFNPSKFED